MYLILVNAEPGVRANPDPKGGVGAVVSCWIDFPDVDGAVALAKYYIRRQGWKVKEVDEASEVTEDAMRTKKGKALFREALEDGWCLHFGVYLDDDGTA